MKKRLIVALLVVMSILSSCCFSLSAYADDYYDSESHSYNASTKTLTIISDKNMVDCTESKISSYPWYSYKSSIEHIIIQEGVTKISDYAFCFEDKLKDITIPSTVSSIGTGAFIGCENLIELYIPSTVSAIKDYAFGYDDTICIYDNFVCICDTKSVAQEYCLSNHIKLSTPIPQGSQSVYSSDGKQIFWSYKASGNVRIDFYSTGIQDTIGLIYDADDYTYSNAYSAMFKSAIIVEDDTDGDINFHIQFIPTAGKTYYFATRLASSSDYGSYNIHFQQECITHEYVITENTSTCVEKGYETYKCKHCNASYKEEVFPKGHTFNESVIPATCTEAGAHIYSCTKCGYTINDILYPNGHNILETKENLVEATCTQDGSYELVKTCRTCNQEISREVIILTSQGHSYEFTELNGDLITLKCINCYQMHTESFLSQYNKTIDQIQDYEIQFDFNEDGIVNAKDYALLKNYLTYGEI